MEPLSSLCLFLALLLPLLLMFKLKSSNSSNGLRLPPGPWRLPVIGSLHHLLRNPLAHRAMADIARRLDAPLIYLQLGEVPMVVASSPDAAREFMKTHDVNFATRPWSPTIKAFMSEGEGLVFARYGPLWRQLRKLCILELLSARRVQSFRRVREEEVGRVVAAIAASPAGIAINVSEQITVLIADSAIRTMIGDRFERREEFLENLAEAIKITTGFTLGDLFPSWKLVSLVAGTTRRALAYHRRQFKLMDHAISQNEERRAAMATGVDDAKPEEDLVDVLLRIQKEGGLDVPLTMGNIKAVIIDLFSAGSETSASTLQWAMSELMRNPEAMRKVQTEIRGSLQGRPTVTEDDLADLKYIKLVIKETLRLHPVVPLLLPRECHEPCKVLGYDIPMGTAVLINVWMISRDPRYWDDPEAFKPERFAEAGAVDFKGTDFAFTPFGAGRRMCPGMAFAQASMELVLATLLYHFDWGLPDRRPSGEVDMAEDIGVTIRRKHDLYLRPILRVPPPASA